MIARLLVFWAALREFGRGGCCDDLCEDCAQEWGRSATLVLSDKSRSTRSP